MELLKLNMPWRAGFLFFLKSVITAGLLVPGFAMPAFAQAKQSDTLRTQRLQPVEIKAWVSALPAASPTPAQILNGPALQRLNSLSVTDAIRYFSGVQLKDYGGVGGLKTVDVRSLGSSQVAVFYDGVQLGNAQNGQVDLGKFSLDNLGSVELYNAQKSTIFQPARGLAAGSAIYLNAKQPDFAPNTANTFKAGFRTGSFGLLNPSFLWQHKLSDRVSGSISTEYTQANGRYKFRYTNGVYDTTAIRSNSDIQAFRAEGSLQGQLRDSSTWSVKVYHYNSDRGLPGAVVANKFDYTQHEWDRNTFIQSSYHLNGKVYSLMLHAKYGDDYLRYLDPEIVTVSGLSDSRYRQKEAYFSAANLFRINAFWTVSTSADYQRNTLRANIYRFAFPTRNTLLTALATQLYWPRFTLQANVIGTLSNETTEAFDAAQRMRKYTPALLLSWQPFTTGALRLRGFYKSLYRLPTFNELYYTFVGSVNLQPEFSRQYDAGFTYQRYFNRGVLRQVSIQTDAYYNQVSNKILAVPGQNLRRWVMENIGRVNIKGLETNAQLTWLLSANLLLNTALSYTFQQARDVSEGSFYNGQIPYTPVHSGSARAGLLWQQWSLTYSYIYTGQRYSQKANIPENYVAPWYTHDASLIWQPVYRGHQVNIAAEVNNLLNQYYDVISNFPMPGRNYRLKFSINI